MTLIATEPSDQRTVSELAAYIRENRVAINAVEGSGTVTTVTSAFNVENAITVVDTDNVTDATTVTNCVNVTGVVNTLENAESVTTVSGDVENIELATTVSGDVTATTTVTNAATVTAATTVTNADEVTTTTTITSAGAVQNATTVNTVTGTVTTVTNVTNLTSANTVQNATNVTNATTLEGDVTTVTNAVGSTFSGSVGTVNEVTDELSDADNDTKIQCEESADEDIVRIDTGGVERVVIDSNGLDVVSGKLRVGSVDIDATPLEINNICDQSALDLSWESSTSDEPVLTLKNTNADNTSPVVRGRKDSVSPADSDRLLTIIGTGNDDGTNTTDYVKIYLKSHDVSDGDESGLVDINVLMDGTERNLLEITGYNGSVNEGTVLVNGANQDIDFIVHDANGDESFMVRGSDGATFIGASLDVTDTLDIETRSETRVAPTGDMVNSGNGNPNMTDNPFDIYGSISASTWESIGPSGSGADNTWSDLSNVPSDADWIKVKIRVSGIDGGASSNVSVNIYSRANGGVQPIGNDNMVATLNDFTTAGGDAYNASINEVTLQLGTGAIFDVYWATSFTTTTISMYLLGWGYNPS